MWTLLVKPESKSTNFLVRTCMQVDDANSMKGRKMKGDEQFIFLIKGGALGKYYVAEIK
jgi:hypothetical protein